ncbi:MAG TPA: trigger factor [Nitrospirota bacterium]|nr:trigger factor [Nitrospirota bacterium]
MKAVLEDVSPVKKKLHIQVAVDVIAHEMGKAVADVARKAKIPGFRPGKAPKSVVERHYAMEIESEVMNKLITASYLQALEEHKLSPVDVPSISNISPFDRNAPLNFTAVVEVRPKIELGAYEGLEVKDHSVAVSDDELNQTIDHLREMYAELQPVEGRALEKTDTAIIDFEGFREGKPIEGAKASGHMLALGTNSLIPGFEEQIVGMNQGESREIAVTFPGDYSNKELAGTAANFTVALKEIKKKVLPELNDEFAKDIGGNKSVAELTEGIKKDLEARKRDELAAAQREEIMAKLIEAHSFEVPQGMVERELQSMARQHVTRMARRGVDVTKTFDAGKFREENRAIAEKRVRGILLLDVIGEKEGVQVSEQEVNSALAAMAKSTGQTLDAVRKYYDSMDGGLDNLRSSITQEKTLALLLSKAKKSYN